MVTVHSKPIAPIVREPTVGPRKPLQERGACVSASINEHEQDDAPAREARLEEAANDAVSGEVVRVAVAERDGERLLEGGNEQAAHRSAHDEEADRDHPQVLANWQQRRRADEQKRQGGNDGRPHHQPLRGVRVPVGEVAPHGGTQGVRARHQQEDEADSEGRQLELHSTTLVFYSI